MANDIHTPPVTTKPLGYREAFEYFDKIESAKTDLKGTIGVMSALIDGDREYDDGVVATLERFLKADMKALDDAFNAAHRQILAPLHGAEFPNATPFGEVGK